MSPVWKKLILAALATCLTVHSAPLSNCLADPSCGPVPGESDIYSTQMSIEPPWPGNATGFVPNTTSGPPGADDVLFQNLLSAEWIIFSFYQQGVEVFNKSAFVEAGFPNTTYERITEIRNNEAGHLRIFQDQISSNSVKPGSCKYEFPFTDATSYLALQTVIEVSSVAFLTGLSLQATLDASKGALVAIAATESRHNTWSLIDNWKTSPFAGPSDTYFPYANQILDFTNEWVVNGSCPSDNPIFPSPRQGLPALSTNATTSIDPGAAIQFVISKDEKPLQLQEENSYYAVFFHGLVNVSMPLDTKNLTSQIPPQLEANGIFTVVIATEEGAPTTDSVVAGPLILLEQPQQIGLAVLSG